MSVESWIIITDERRASGMLAAARTVSSSVTAAVAGTTELADVVASLGFDKVILFETADGVPAEALAADVAARAKADAPTLVVSGDVAGSRVIAGAVAGACGAAVLADVIELKEDGGALVLSHEIASRKAIEDVKAEGPVVAIYTGPDADAAEGAKAEVEKAAVSQVVDVVVGTAEPEGAGLATAQRVVAVGMGISKKDDLAITDALAQVLGAFTACSLPVSEDMHWYDPSHVVGSSHNTTAPELYLAVGISGSPNHTSGFRDAKVAVAINNDPNAEIFNVSKYGIVGDLYKVVPALTKALS